jgi:hypothetical protein
MKPSAPNLIEQWNDLIQRKRRLRLLFEIAIASPWMETFETLLEGVVEEVEKHVGSGETGE